MGQVVRSGKQGRWAWAFRRLTLGISDVHCTPPEIHTLGDRCLNQRSSDSPSIFHLPGTQSSDSADSERTTRSAAARRRSLKSIRATNGRQRNAPWARENAQRRTTNCSGFNLCAICHAQVMPESVMPGGQLAMWEFHVVS